MFEIFVKTLSNHNTLFGTILGYRMHAITVQNMLLLWAAAAVDFLLEWFSILLLLQFVTYMLIAHIPVR